MDRIVSCPACGASNRLPEATGGKTVVCGKCKTPLAGGGAGGHPVDVTDASFASTISTGRVVVDFWAAWCGPCRMIAPILEELASERADVRFAKLNVDQNPRTASQFGVQGIPLLIFFRDGREAGRVTGAVPKGHIEQAIRQYLGTER
ncbi:MAG TPA: thioredoxin [Thermoanaerobaculia bacterium]|jgi:thioredoxin 2